MSKLPKIIDITFILRRIHQIRKEYNNCNQINDIINKFNEKYDYPEYQMMLNYRDDKAENNYKFIKPYNTLYDNINDWIDKYEKKNNNNDNNDNNNDNNDDDVELSLQGLPEDLFNLIQIYFQFREWCIFFRLNKFWNIHMNKYPLLYRLDEIPPLRCMFCRFQRVQVLSLNIDYKRLLSLFNYDIFFANLHTLIVYSESFRLTYVEYMDVTPLKMFFLEYLLKKINLNKLNCIQFIDLAIDVQECFNKMGKLLPLTIKHIIFKNVSFSYQLKKYEQIKKLRQRWQSDKSLFCGINHITFWHCTIDCYEPVNVLLNNCNLVQNLKIIECHPSSLIADCVQPGTIFYNVEKIKLYEIKLDIFGNTGNKNLIFECLPNVKHLIIDHEKEYFIRELKHCFYLISRAINHWKKLQKITLIIHHFSILIVLQEIQKLLNQLQSKKIKIEIKENKAYRTGEPIIDPHFSEEIKNDITLIKNVIDFVLMTLYY